MAATSGTLPGDGDDVSGDEAAPEAPSATDGGPGDGAAGAATMSTAALELKLNQHQPRSSRTQQPQPRWVFIVAVAIGSYFGVLARMTLSWFAAWLARVGDSGGASSSILLAMDGATESGVGFLLPNLVGTAVMGAFVRLGEPLLHKWPVLYTAVTTGFCGCCTTFSAWNVFVAASLVQGDVASAVAASLLHVPLCVGALRFGSHCGSAISQRLYPQQELTTRVRDKIHKALADAVAHTASLEGSSGDVAVPLVASAISEVASGPQVGLAGGSDDGPASGAGGGSSSDMAPVDDAGVVAMTSAEGPPAATRDVASADAVVVDVSSDARGSRTDGGDDADGGMDDASESNVEPAARPSAALAALRESIDEQRERLDLVYRAMHGATLRRQQSGVAATEGVNTAAATTRRLVTTSFVLATAAVWTLFAAADAWPDWQAVWLSAAMGPVGAVLRYELSRFNKAPLRLCGRKVCNVKTWHFPLFTLMPNAVGTLLSALMARLATTGRGGDAVVVSAISVGLCGSLSTVSTFMVETSNLRVRRHQYRYVLGSIAVAQVCGALVLGV